VPGASRILLHLCRKEFSTSHFGVSVEFRQAVQWDTFENRTASLNLLGSILNESARWTTAAYDEECWEPGSSPSILRFSTPDYVGLRWRMLDPSSSPSAINFQLQPVQACSEPNFLQAMADFLRPSRCTMKLSTKMRARGCDPDIHRRSFLFWIWTIRDWPRQMVWPPVIAPCNFPREGHVAPTAPRKS
jgi:hypothetical protein